MTIVNAILSVMREAKRPLTANEIYERIGATSAYSFSAKQPYQIVLQQIRRHCSGIDNASSSARKLFARVGKDRYVPLP